MELDNGAGLLRANMFGRARINAGDSRQAITVPKEAVRWEGCCNVAFVRSDDAATTFKPARLVLAYDAGDRYEVIGGLSPGDIIVTRGNYIPKNEILKSAVGAVCCEVDHLKKCPPPNCSRSTKGCDAQAYVRHVHFRGQADAPQART